MGRPTKWGFEYRGVWKSVQQWSRELGISVKTLKKRLRSGWTPEKIVNTVPQGDCRRKSSEPCKGCDHWKVYSGMDASGCHYFLDTGQLRSVPYEKCERRKQYVERMAEKAAAC